MLYEKLNHRLILIILSQLFFLVNRIVYGQYYIPGPRVGSRSVLVTSKIYYIGGYNPNKGIVDNGDVFYFDNEMQFSPQGLLPLVDLGDQAKIPFMSWPSASLGGANQDSIFIIGGARLDDTAPLVYQIDTKTNATGPPAIQGKTPTGRRDMDAVTYEGKIYLFSGRTFISDVITLFNNFDILNTITMTWEVGSLVNAPTPRFSYTATLVNGVIYYIGGARQQGQINIFEQMSNIYQYDIVSSTWSLKKATAVGPMPQGRAYHTAVNCNGTIYIYGGETEALVAVQGPIILLDTTTLQWSLSPQFININTPKVNDIPRLVSHTAELLELKYMFLAFGNVTDNMGSANFNNYYYIFSLEKLVWLRLSSNGDGNPKSLAPPPVTSINPPSPPNPTNPSSLPTSTTTSSVTPTIPSSPAPVIQQQSNTIAIIGLSSGLAVFGLGAIAAFVFVYKRIKKKNQDETMNMNQSPTTSRHPSSYHPADYRQSFGYSNNP